jgi:Flp pilus assembly protein TadD
VNNRTSLGSGVVFSPTGLVITNNHVIEDADFGSAFGQITVESSKSVDQPVSDAVCAELVIRNEVYDLAIIKLTAGPPVQFIDLLKPPAVDPSLMERRIRVLGYPPLGGATITVTRGIVSGFDETGNLKTDAEINHGNSGGAALDDLGTFIGIPGFLIADERGKLGFIISVDRIRQWLGSVLKSGIPETTEQLEAAFASSNLNFAGDNLDSSNKYPRILGKFAAVETLLRRNEYEKVLRHIEFILEKRPRSGLAYQYRGDALLGLGRYVEAADQYRTCLAYNPGHIPALGNLGVALLQLKRHGEALQIFEQTVDNSDDPVHLWAAYTNIAKIYEDWGQIKVSKLNQDRAAELSAAAKERMLQYDHHEKGGVKTLAEAIVYTEIKMEDEATNADE